MDPDTRTVVLPNFVSGRFTHFTSDNIAINDSNFDGKNSFHATQVAAWQRGPESDMGMELLRPSKNTTLDVPDVLADVVSAQVGEKKVEPTAFVDKNWFVNTECGEEIEAVAKDTAFFVKRQDNRETAEQGWIHFNQVHSKVNPKVTSIGYMPIIQAPAHEYDTLHSVVMRYKYVARQLNQHYVVLTVDEALYCKLMELKWTKPEYQDFLVVRLGGLHTALKFLQVIGKLMQSSGLEDVWTESNCLGPKTAEHVLSGSSYAKGMRIHKLTVQAMYRVLVPKLQDFLNKRDQDLANRLLALLSSSGTDDLVTLLCTAEFREAVDAFVESTSSSNFKFWWSYIQMVELLLLFTSAQRDGLWQLHLQSFTSMLPYFFRYNHTNYARWGTVYVSEMHNLPAEVEAEFDQGNFVVKRSDRQFNQVSPDQSQEWLNGTGKTGGGIVGITKTTSALSRWALSLQC